MTKFEKWELIVRLTKSELPWSIDMGKGDDEIYLIYRHFGPEGQRMDTTLIVTDVKEEEI